MISDFKKINWEPIRSESLFKRKPICMIHSNLATLLLSLTSRRKMKSVRKEEAEEAWISLLCITWASLCQYVHFDQVVFCAAGFGVFLCVVFGVRSFCVFGTGEASGGENSGRVESSQTAAS